jgi:hypothetical protein
MARDKPPVEITREELAFIRRLCRRDEEGDEAQPGTAVVESPDSAAGLLQLLSMADKLRVEADVGRFTLIFEPHADTSPQDGKRHFHLGYPSIVEKNGHLRSYRITRTGGDIQLRENGNQLRNVRIEDISETGIGLISENVPPRLQAGRSVLSLQLAFPHEQRAPCKARVVRVRRHGGKTRLALHLISAPRRTHELLRAYVYHHSPPFTPVRGESRGEE